MKQEEKRKEHNIKNEKREHNREVWNDWLPKRAEEKRKKVEQTRKEKEEQQKQSCRDKSKNHPQEQKTKLCTTHEVDTKCTTGTCGHPKATIESGCAVKIAKAGCTVCVLRLVTSLLEKRTMFIRCCNCS